MYDWVKFSSHGLPGLYQVGQLSKYYSAYFHFKKITSDDTSDVYYNISGF